ncbi:beta-galactosidase [Anaerocolumna cellulosilytica]|uniref:Beta-galactosidase n=1 Tax=Anaerocolumna cellulosilytica TaxID=433286 RepID=A0A6S6R0Y5_9FIRM|nr:glycoside hydrolase family 2 TIM barrel-domain containing protein [Anaerocolumna cellulosilytica]MBB5194312.1 beta-galactosidase [Anaerocolumna cellulosilytica]BCJ93255.1 beta-galactosidase [Anaerocolumna cellulosilytica]
MHKIDFNDRWVFIKEGKESYIEKEIPDGEYITLPHCFNGIDGQSGDGMYKGKTCYQKKVALTGEELREYHYLEIGAASLVSHVYINGILAGSSRCGFSMYRVFLNPLLKEGENLISIVVDNSRFDDVYPLMADFSFYGGLYREVSWITTRALHFELLDNSRDGMYITQKAIKNGIYELKIKGSVINELHNKLESKIKVTLLDKEGNGVLSKTMKCAVIEKEEFEFIEELNQPRLWQGIEDPYLYTLKVELYQEEQLVDERNLEIGFRTIEITPDKGVFLNGKPIKLNGVSRHQDFAEVGNALTKEHMELDMSLIKEIGANSIRLSHYQHHDYFYTLCDRAGLLVWAEIPFISVPSTADKENQNAKDQLERLIKQAYNHCSIYCWGIQNEITIAIENEQIYEMVKELAAIARNLDAVRYIAQANIHSVANESSLNDLTDFVGYNLYYGWYYKEMKDLAVRLDEFHKVRPNIPVMVTEYGVDTNPVLHSYTPSVKDYTEEYQLLFQENALKTFKEREYVLGGYVWALFDFGSEIRNEGGTKGKNQKGLVTIDRKIKKDTFYLCKAYWSKEKFVKLAGSRFVNRHQEENDMVVLSNVNSVKLFVGEKMIGERNDHEPVKIFKGVKLAHGENFIRVEAVDSEGNCYYDEMFLNRVKDMDLSYVLKKTEEKTTVTNWFQKFDLTNVQEVAIKEGYYSTFDTIEELYKNEEAKAVFKKYFGDLAENPQMATMRGLMTIDSMSKRSRFNIPKELLSVINKELNVIEKRK